MTIAEPLVCNRPVIAVKPFQPEDLALIAVQDAQVEETGDWLALGRSHAAGGRAFTARGPDGTILMCGGAHEVHSGYATLWAVFADAAGPLMLGLTRRTRMIVDRLPHARVDAMVRVGHLDGHRWARLLGLAEEATLACVFADGADARIYRRKGAR